MLVANAVSRLPSRIPAAANDQARPGLSSLFSRQPVETFGRGETICRDGDPALHVFEVAAGIVRVAKVFSDGSRVIPGFFQPGEFFGTSPGERYLGDAEAIGEVKLRRLSRNGFRQAVDRCERLRPEFADWLCREMVSAQARTVLLACKNAEERVCDLLLALARQVGGADGPARAIELSMSRVNMADYLGLTIETASRTMTNLIGCGAIRSAGWRS